MKDDCLNKDMNCEEIDDLGYIFYIYCYTIYWLVSLLVIYLAFRYVKNPFSKIKNFFKKL
jgi:hypothetical protein